MLAFSPADNDHVAVLADGFKSFELTKLSGDHSAFFIAAVTV